MVNFGPKWLFPLFIYTKPKNKIWKVQTRQQVCNTFLRLKSLFDRLIWWKLIKRKLTKTESGSPKGSSQALPLLKLQTQQQKTHLHISTISYYFTTSTGGRKVFLRSQPASESPNSWKATIHQTPLYFNGLFVYNGPSNCPQSFPLRKCSSPWLSGLPCGFATVCLP